MLHGSKQLCGEYSLVLEARDIEHVVREIEGGWLLTVPPSMLQRAIEEISRYTAERSIPRSIPQRIEPHSGAALGAIAYTAILLLIAYCAGSRMFGMDWLSAGALDAGAAREWWRAFTALTLHVDQEHLLGNLLFGVVVGIAAGQLLGPGVGWASIVGAAALANTLEVLVSPATHHAVGASTAVFAGLGLLTGMAWQPRLSSRERAWYRWAPLIAGASLLTLLGAGTEHVDVLGHGLGFLFGVGIGWVLARAKISRYREPLVQMIAGIATLILVGIAWLLAINHAT
ncbi:MAG TPA: rhomboid family intramembrane serine protease [Steroidobacteraceae bacterium]